MPSWYRWAVVVVATLLLCSCSAPMSQRAGDAPPRLAPVVMGTSARRNPGRRQVQAAAKKKSSPFATRQEVAQSTVRQVERKESGTGLPHFKESAVLAPIVSRSELAFESPASEEAAFEVLSSEETAVSNEVVSLQDGVDWNSAPPIPIAPPLALAETPSADGETDHETEPHEALPSDLEITELELSVEADVEPGPAEHATPDQAADAPNATLKTETSAVKPQRIAVFRRLNDEPVDLEPSASDLPGEDDDLWTDALDPPSNNESIASFVETTEMPIGDSTVQHPLPPAGQPESLPLESMPAEVPQEAWHSPALPGVADCAPTCETAACGPTVPPWQMYPDEYLCDGGDDEYAVEVNQDWTVRNLDTEDTVGHYDTLDGRVIVEPSNRVCIYAPRFAAVRKVTGVSEHEATLRPLAADRPDQPVTEKQAQMDELFSQHEAPQRHLLIQQASVFRDRVPPTEAVSPIALSQYARDLKPHEDFYVVRWGVHKQAEKARLAEFTDAAITWSHDSAVQVVIDKLETVSRDTVQGVETVFEFERMGTPRLRVCKTASTSDAQPGEIVEFALRFDNVGQQVIGNVTIIDNLTTRLEYVPDSAECSIKAAFFTDENDAESLVLRWEIDAPLEPGKGGIIRFKCRVR